MRNKHKLIEELTTPVHLEGQLYRDLNRLKKQISMIKQILEGEKDENNHCDDNSDDSSRV